MYSRMMGTILTVVLLLSGVAGAKIVYVDSTQSSAVSEAVGYWTMDDNAATKVVVDSGPNLINGTAVRNTSAMSVAGKLGQALTFDGTGDQIDFGTNSKLLPDAWTFAAWVKCTDTASTTLISFGGTYPAVKLQQNNKGKPLMYMGANNYRYFNESAWTTLKDGQWHFVAFSIPGSAQTDIQNAKMYLDGVPVEPGTVLATGPQQAKTRFLIGNNGITGTQRFKGSLDNAKLYNRALTDAEVLQIYQSMILDLTSTSGYWKMEDNAATQVVVDSGPNLINGTAVRNTSAMSVAGKFGQALAFDGTGDQIDFGTNPKLLPNAWTFTAWVKCADKTSSTLFSFGGTYPSVKLEHNNKGKPLMYMGANNYRYFNESAWTILKDGQWHFVVFSIPGSAQTDIQNAKMYLDGMAVESGTVLATGPQQAKTRFLIGNSAPTGTQRFKGAIDNAKLYNRALTDAEVLQIYQPSPPGFTGTSWTSAFKTIGEAITAAVANDEIWVKKGTYTLTQPLTVDKVLKFYGGFAGTEIELAQRNVQLNLTTVDGNNAAYHCFLVPTALSEVTIDGFTITRGAATGPQENDRTGGGVLSRAVSTTLANCVIKNNTATASGGGLALFGDSGMQHCRIQDNTAGNAAGVYSSIGTLHLQDCQITGNTAAQQGGGLFCIQNAPVIETSFIQNNHAATGAGAFLNDSPAQFASCTISGNQASIDGGGIYNFGEKSNCMSRKCWFAANTANRGGAVFDSTTVPSDPLAHPDSTRNSMTFSNCILVLNTAQDGGAIYLDKFVSSSILNCTFSGNHAQRGGGLFVFESYSLPHILNSILWGDSSVTGHPEIFFAPTGGTMSYPDNVEVYYCDIMTGWADIMPNIANLDLDPAFVDLDGPDNNALTWQDNDYRLLPDSPLVNKGKHDIGGVLVGPSEDILGTIRPQGAEYDIGAYEYASGQGLEFQADFDLDYSYTAPVQTQSFSASTQSCDVTWWLGLTNSSGGVSDWNINSVIFETPNTLGNFFPNPPVISGNQYKWSSLLVTDKTELEARQTTVKKDAAIPFTVTRAYAGNTILGAGEMTTTVTVTPQAGLASFSVKIGVAPAWTEADWWNGLYIGTVQHLSAQVAGNTSGQLSHRDTPELQEYEWEFKSYAFGQPITFIVRTRVALKSGVPSAYLEPRVTVSGNRMADYGGENWQNGTLTLPNGTGRVILDTSSSMLTLDGYLPWYELILPHFAKPITGDANNDGTTDILDLLILSENWLMPCNAGNNYCNGADFDRSGKVDLIDFTLLSEFWLRNN